MTNVATAVVWHGAPYTHTLHRQEDAAWSFRSEVTIASPNSRLNEGVLAAGRSTNGSPSEAIDEADFDLAEEVRPTVVVAKSANVVVGKGDNRQGGPWSLTQRELEVIQLLAEGSTNGEISARLFISPKTTKNHLAAIFQKLEVTNRTQALVRAVVMGLVSIE
jgi:DNA-binding CsgD family transcriptional regulator